MLLFICAYYNILANNANFNTSHVTVYPMMQQLLRLPQKNFNTSHVTVYLSCPVVPMMVSFDFNTSHVTVYRKKSCRTAGSNTISIHLMLLFIVWDTRETTSFYDFNTSHVTVYLFAYGKVVKLKQFQYISCYCLSNGFPPFSIFLFPTNPLYLRFFSFLPSILLESFLYSIITYISLIFKLF